MVSKVVVSVVSIVLVVGVVLSVAVGVHNIGKDKDGENTTPQMKAVSSMCAPTDYKEACENSLKAATDSGTTDPKELIKAAIQSTVDEAVKSFNLSSSLLNDAGNDTRVKMAMEDCKELMQYAVDQAQATFSMVGDSQLHTLSDRANELRQWLSSVISYQVSCLDQLEDHPKFKSAMSNSVVNATQLTSNALVILEQLSTILGSFNIDLSSLKPNLTSRRLLSSNGFDHAGYPTWMSAADRKLLAARGNTGRLPPNAVVAKDGSGQYKSINAALAAYPKNFKGRYVIYVKQGIYNEEVLVDKNMVNVYMYGDGPRKTIVTGHKNTAIMGFNTMRTATFSAVGAGFICRSMGFQNTAGPDGHQAVALRVQSEKSAFYNCRMDGYQDTLYGQTNRQFYRNCVISGTVDFIFGDSTLFIQNSLIISRKPNDNQFITVTAHGRQVRHETTGIVIQNCRFVPEQKLFRDRFRLTTYLGRPWKPYSRTIVMESSLGDHINPDGWMKWSGEEGFNNTAVYQEYLNRGPGARFNRRIRWKNFKVITNKNEALQYSAGRFINDGNWLRTTMGQYFVGLKY